ncbi:hypothetical protein [Butyrivibrio proteoclasticus]|uniref:hypothetical protein n=1 Tax=Butyrivibrio proteoclasticus TaxID=43305 RepID=UPI0012DF47A5|nr:hypothetical protein [Butyrivibrio proteoclasticus]
MKKSSVVNHNEVFYCEHLVLTRKTMQDIDDFRVTNSEGKGLLEYLQNNAYHDEKLGAQRIYLVRDMITDELVAFFGLKTGMVSQNERAVKIDNEERIVFDMISGIELAELAVNDIYIRHNPASKGCGLIIFNDFILPICEQAKQLVGCEILYGFSVDEKGKLLDRYLNEYNFARLDPESEAKVQDRLRPYFDKGCVFIYQKI